MLLKKKFEFRYISFHHKSSLKELIQYQNIYDKSNIIKNYF